MKTRKHLEKDLVVYFLELLTMIKLHHWKTTCYAMHKATDELYATLQKNVDSYVEILLGTKETRFQYTRTQMAFKDCSPDHFLRELKKTCATLNQLKLEGDLETIRDEMVGHIHQFLYLASMK